MLEASFTVTITAEDLHEAGATTVTTKLLDEVASMLEDVYQECLLRYQIEDALEAIDYFDTDN